MTRSRKLFPGRWLAFAAAIAAGCAPKTYPVQGKLTWADGSPAAELAGAQVVFESAALKVGARGDVKADGGFLLSTYKTDDGVPPGDYQVAVIEHRPSPEGKFLSPAVMDPKFSSFATSGLTATVKSGPNPVTIAVERANGAKKVDPPKP
jgi:hypothetical protein